MRCKYSSVHISKNNSVFFLEMDSLTSKEVERCQAAELNRMLHGWLQAANMLRSGEITQEEYDRWRHYYPEYDKSRTWAKIPSKELSDALVEALTKETE